MDEEERIEDEREEVAEDSSPETNEEAVEQRTDDYDGIVRRLDDLRDMLQAGLEDMRRNFDAMGLAAETAGYVDDTIDAADVAEDVADTIDELVGLEALDLL
jgi:proteasome assembly chaperone (PAC2) family protein